jgi:biopolymer transport protein ExbB/TolQ
MAVLLFIIYMLVLIIFGLVVFAVMQIKMAGLTVKDFWSFIEANQELDKLDKIAKKYEKMTIPQQIMFLKEAEKIFSAFDKVPASIWEEETNKYQNVLEAYKDIKVMRWIENDKSNVKEEVTDTK